MCLPYIPPPRAQNAVRLTFHHRLPKTMGERSRSEKCFSLKVGQKKKKKKSLLSSWVGFHEAPSLYPWAAFTQMGKQGKKRWRDGKNQDGDCSISISSVYRKGCNAYTRLNKPVLLQEARKDPWNSMPGLLNSMRVHSSKLIKASWSHRCPATSSHFPPSLIKIHFSAGSTGLWRAGQTVSESKSQTWLLDEIRFCHSFLCPSSIFVTCCVIHWKLVHR